MKIPLKNCKTGRQGRGNAHQTAQQKKPNRLKMVGHLYKTHLENRSSTSLILCDATKKKACDILYVTGSWCARRDSNPRHLASENYDATRNMMIHCDFLLVLHCYGTPNTSNIKQCANDKN